MRKFKTGLTLFLAAVAPLFAISEPRVVDFLKKLNKYYYCQSREGLKGYICDFTVTVSDSYCQSLLNLGEDPKVVAVLNGQKGKLTLRLNGKSDCHLNGAASSGDKRFDKALDEELLNIGKNMQPVLNTWFENAFKPIYNEASFKRDCTVTNGPDGFTVEEKYDDDFIQRQEYGRDAKLKRIVGIRYGKTILSMDFNYSAGPKGYLLDSYTGAGAGVTETDQFTYGTVGGYFLPTRIVKTGQFAQILNGTITLDFSNFRLLH